jgi:prophage regulatory protein
MSSQTHTSKTRFQDLPDEAFIRLRQMLSLHVVPYSASTLWRRCRSNEFPRPIKVSPGITAWKVGDVRAHLESLSSKPTKGGAA